LIDTHSHIYLSEFDSDLEQVVLNAKEAGVTQVLMPNVDVSTMGAMHRVEMLYPTFCKSMMGLHPTSVDANYQKPLDEVLSQFQNRSYVAVGEIGIDLYWDKTFLSQQIVVFEKQLVLAKQLKLPVVIHCRDAFKEVFEVVERQMDADLRGVFHSFTGSAQDAATIMSYPQFMLGINGVVTFKNSSLREVLTNVDISRLVLETDAPYLAPVPYRGRRNEPSYLTHVATTLAGVYGCTFDEVDVITTQNAQKLFNL